MLAASQLALSGRGGSEGSNENLSSSSSRRHSSRNSELEQDGRGDRDHTVPANSLKFFLTAEQQLLVGSHPSFWLHLYGRYIAITDSKNLSQHSLLANLTSEDHPIFAG